MHLPPYYGIIDWKDFKKALKEIGFDGVLSLEFTSPSGLSDDIFEDISKIYAKIAKELAEV